MIDPSPTLMPFAIPPRDDERNKLRESVSRPSSSSSFRSWSFRDDECVFKKTATGDLPSSKQSECAPRMIGCPPSSTLSSEHWSSFYKRFQDKSGKKNARAHTMPQSEVGMLSKFASRMFTDCTRVLDCRRNASDEWVEYREVPLPKRFTNVPQPFQSCTEEQYRVFLTE